MFQSTRLLAAPGPALTLRGLWALGRGLRAPARTLTDTCKPDSSTKQVVVQGKNKTADVRIRRARPTDVPRVLRFVREYAQAAWPHAPAPAPRSTIALVIADYVSRALAQGHSLIAEQVDGRRGWLTVRGLALGACVSPWDAQMLEKCALCVRCPRARRTLQFAAHCLRAPKLHDKYNVHRILQVVMVVPVDQASPALVRPLLQAAVKRAKDAGIPLVRVDITSNDIAKILEELQFKKEWYMEYQVVPEAIAEDEAGEIKGKTPSHGDGEKHFLAVYTTTIPTKKKPSEATLAKS